MNGDSPHSSQIGACDPRFVLGLRRIDLELGRVLDAITAARHALEPIADTARGGADLRIFSSSILDGRWALQRAMDEAQRIGLPLPDPWPWWKGTRPW